MKWRHDYDAARKEAAATGRPLLFDIGTEACGWCKKLDATTLRDPAVVRALNDRFIPVRVDAGKNAKLADGLGAEGYPTLVLAAPDGKVVGRHAGYADVAQLTALLRKAPAAKVAPAPGADEVRARLDASAAAALRQILDDLNRPDPPQAPR
jgi:thioredoxin-like negative regulator of GroEL